MVAKDKKDWVQCDRCKCWSHPSCYRIAQNVIAKEDMQFCCFFCVMERMAREEEDTALQCGRQERQEKTEKDVTNSAPGRNALHQGCANWTAKGADT